MHIHVPHRPAWGVLLVLTGFGLWLGSFEFVRLVQILRARSLPVVPGQVLQREEINRWDTMPAARLTIREAARGETIIAVMPNWTADRFEGAVQFHYSGDPRRPVHLVGEDNPLWLVMFLWGVPVLLWLVYFKLKRSACYRSMVE